MNDSIGQIAYLLTKCRLDSEPYVDNGSGEADYGKVLEVMAAAFIEINKVVLAHMKDANNG